MVDECPECGSETISVMPHVGGAQEAHLKCFECDEIYIVDFKYTFSSTVPESEETKTQSTIEDFF